MAGSTVTAVTFPNRFPGRTGPTTPKRGLKGAAGGIYVGPVLSKAATKGPSTITHATGAAAGGVEDSTGARESDTYVKDGTSSGGFSGGAAVSNTRPTGRTAYTANGVVGGSTPGDPIDSTGRTADDSGVDRFGRTNQAGTRYTYTNFDGRADLSGDGGRALGGAGRGTTVVDETVTVNQDRPTIHSTAESSGTLAIVDGTGKVQGAIAADDIDGGANGHRGAIVFLYKRNTDTDEDNLSMVRCATIGTVSTDGTDDTDLFTGLTAGTYAVYAAWLYDTSGPAAAVARGPLSARATVVVS